MKCNLLNKNWKICTSLSYVGTSTKMFGQLTVDVRNRGIGTGLWKTLETHYLLLYKKKLWEFSGITAMHWQQDWTAGWQTSAAFVRLTPSVDKSFWLRTLLLHFIHGNVCTHLKINDLVSSSSNSVSTSWLIRYFIVAGTTNLCHAKGHFVIKMWKWRKWPWSLKCKCSSCDYTLMFIFYSIWVNTVAW